MQHNLNEKHSLHLTLLTLKYLYFCCPISARKENTKRNLTPSTHLPLTAQNNWDGRCLTNPVSRISVIIHTHQCIHSLKLSSLFGQSLVKWKCTRTCTNMFVFLIPFHFGIQRYFMSSSCRLPWMRTFWSRSNNHGEMRFGLVFTIDLYLTQIALHYGRNTWNLVLLAKTSSIEAIEGSCQFSADVTPFHLLIHRSEFLHQDTTWRGASAIHD